MHNIRRIATALAVLVTVSIAGPALGKDKPGDVLSDWVGNWTAGPEQDIAILRAADGALLIEGFATWGASDPERVERGGVHVGEFTVSVPGNWIVGAHLAFAIGENGAIRGNEAGEYDCALRLEARDSALFVSDNGMCGGQNVRFNGRYLRTK